MTIKQFKKKIPLTDKEKQLIANKLVVSDHFKIVYVFAYDKNEKIGI